MKIDVQKYSGPEAQIQIISDKWYWDNFWLWFITGTCVIILCSLMHGYTIVPQTYNLDEWDEKIAKREKKWCCKF